MKILCACGNGMGTSLMMKLKVETILKNLLKTNFTVDSCSVSEASSILNNYDLIICSVHLEKQFEGKNIKVVGLQNIMDQVEIENKLKAVL